VGGVEVVSETERVERSEPTMVGVSAFRGLPDEDVIGLEVASHVSMMREPMGVCQCRLSLKLMSFRYKIRFWVTVCCVYGISATAMFCVGGGVFECFAGGGAVEGFAACGESTDSVIGE
jgi:hypothetical protein